ncbi:alkaline phosphatase D [Actinoalloteichus hymeniacidonis]|uniref:Phosphodiesterase/alkaline phosphatase D n=2 Tax=Actinoalloteichus hymeniacidonis TaxID=340345 RepID=A0AAC9HV62_9PSEU|nr:phosphodiesterase/alkaline phosphatase D [Actinoalloteichus hymeniacidonis]MBB5906169.1 alkaline phosphatase D [Actinoalloteichus hymeniacidonis]
MTERATKPSLVPTGRSALSRRSMLVAGTAAAGLTVVAPAAGWAGPAGATDPGSTPAAVPPRDPFTLGVASGDPFPDGMVLWTRLAPDPLAEDGMGGMPARNVAVQWELARDERFRRVVRRGTEHARPELGHSVHVELSGLRSGTEYFFRFRSGRHHSPVGRTRTAPEHGVLGGGLSMCFASCAQYEHGYFTAYRRLAEEEPDLVLHLGDYQYEYRAGDYDAPGGNVRDHDGPETETLANYRQRHAQYKADTDLQAAHAVAPWLVVWDDHEIDNNWAGEVPEKPEIPQPDFAARRTAAAQAYYENMPLRRSSVPAGVDIRLYRKLRWGGLANFHMMDTRQYRDDQACGDGWKDCDEAGNPTRTITGAEQEAWLLDGFRRSRARWDILGQQVFFTQRENASGANSMDAWDGYAASRDRVTQGWVDAGVRNAVVLTGDVHTHWANEVKLDYNDPDSRSVGTELVCSSITSGGDGADSDPNDNESVQLNPHIKFFNGQRGYVRTRITRDELRADFRVVDRVSVPDAQVHTRASFVVPDREATLHEA